MKISSQLRMLGRLQVLLLRIWNALLSEAEALGHAYRAALSPQHLDGGADLGNCGLLAACLAQL